MKEHDGDDEHFWIAELAEFDSRDNREAAKRGTV
jgi:hypothetical protein